MLSWKTINKEKTICEESSEYKIICLNCKVIKHDIHESVFYGPWTVLGKQGKNRIEEKVTDNDNGLFKGKVTMQI